MPPFGNDAVVTTNSGSIANDRIWSSVRPIASVTRTVNVHVPTAVGVPEMTPPVDRVSPVGSVPADSDHANGDVPFDADSVRDTAMLTVPFVSVAVEITGAADSEIDIDRVADCEAASVTVKVIVKVPVTVGVPQSSPDAAVRFRPAGSEVDDHE